MGKLLIAISLAWAVLAAAVVPVRADSLQEAYRHLEIGNSYHKSGQFKKAAEEYKAAWEKGKLLDACFNLALTYDRDLNENELAVKYYSEYLAADPYLPEADEVRQMEDNARREIKQSVWWLEGKEKKKNKDREEALLSVIRKKQAEDALALEKGREEDKYPGQSHVCLGCHAGFMGPQINMASTHPVGRVPTGDLAKTVPKEVRFYQEGQVVCLSCHNPTNLHFEMGTPGINYKYLRVDTAGGEDLSRFCAYCHLSKSSSRFLPGGEREERRPLDIRR